VKHDLPLTGERTIPGVPHENYWFRRHEAAYQALTSYCRDRVVLEAGSAWYLRLSDPHSVANHGMPAPRMPSGGPSPSRFPSRSIDRRSASMSSRSCLSAVSNVPFTVRTVAP